ncbi:MAG: GNAT family N-acetyltransferase [Thermoguttaceae bacterium]|jgi:GNAT superfamily N-acetyltransferase
MAEIRVEPFDAARHRRVGFDCGKPALDGFLSTLVSQYENRHLGKTFVAVRTGGAGQVVGYYTLAASAVSFDNMPPEIAMKLPRHPVPMILVARLAVDRRAQGEGLGKALLHDALQRALGISKSLGVFAVEVFAIDEQAAGFYAKFGFTPMLDDPRHMYLPTRTIEGARA